MNVDLPNYIPKNLYCSHFSSQHTFEATIEFQDRIKFSMKSMSHSQWKKQHTNLNLLNYISQLLP